MPSLRRRSRDSRSGSPGTSTGNAGSTAGVACKTSITASRSSSKAPSGRNAFGSIAMKKWPSRSGSPGFWVLFLIGEKEAPDSAPPRMCTIRPKPLGVDGQEEGPEPIRLARFLGLVSYRRERGARQRAAQDVHHQAQAVAFVARHFRRSADRSLAAAFVFSALIDYFAGKRRLR